MASMGDALRISTLFLWHGSDYFHLLTRLFCRLSRLEVRQQGGYLSKNESGDACIPMSISQNATVFTAE